MDFQVLADWLKIEEGFRAKPYKCSAGHWTQGYGRNLENHYFGRQLTNYLKNPPTVNESQAREWLIEDICNAFNDTQELFPNIGKFTEARQQALTAMVFQMGQRGVAKFLDMIAHIKRNDWSGAADAALDSKWARQTPERAKRTAEMLRNG